MLPMRMLIFTLLPAFFLAISCQKTDNGILLTEPAYTEEFDTASAATGRGWTFVNASIEMGRHNWENPSDPPPFDAWSTRATRTGFLWTDYESTSSPKGIISNWAISPAGTIRNGDRIVFYTRAQILYHNFDSTDLVNRLQVRLSRSGESRNCGIGDETGDFKTLLLDINPQYQEFRYSEFIAGTPESRSSYPHRWTRFEVTVSGLEAPVKGRYAFRYYVEGGGSNGRSSGIGLDQVSFFPVPIP